MSEDCLRLIFPLFLIFRSQSAMKIFPDFRSLFSNLKNGESNLKGTYRTTLILHYEMSPDSHFIIHRRHRPKEMTINFR